ncbi:hypothetical protein DFH09DRAFT_1097611 [Mycena vulgaris]|nr:hypothetical protein DFH09DRAFT_1097611 [Mycena vulgaris]
MSSKSAIDQIRFKNIVACLNTAVTTVELVSKGLKTPFLESIVTTVCSLLTAAQNKEDSHNFEHWRRIDAEILNYLGQFTKTLQKIHTFVEAQQGKGGIKLFFRQAEMSTLLTSCTAGLEEALDVFEVI